MKVRALRTQIGDYGQKFPGDEFVVSASVGKQLVDNGRVEEVEEEETEKEEIEEEKEKKEVKHTSKKKIDGEK